MELKQWHGFCLCPLGGVCPPDAVPADAPFSPLVFLVRRDPLRSRGLFAVAVLDEVFEAETAGVLLPPAQGTTPAEPLREFVAANGALRAEHGVFRRILRSGALASEAHTAAARHARRARRRRRHAAAGAEAARPGAGRAAHL